MFYCGWFHNENVGLYRVTSNQIVLQRWSLEFSQWNLSPCQVKTTLKWPGNMTDLVKRGADLFVTCQSRWPVLYFHYPGVKTILSDRKWNGFTRFILCVFCVCVCVGGHPAALAKPTEYDLKSPETNIHKERNRLWTGGSEEEEREVR